MRFLRCSVTLLPTADELQNSSCCILPCVSRIISTWRRPKQFAGWPNVWPKKRLIQLFQVCIHEKTLLQPASCFCNCWIWASTCRWSMIHSPVLASSSRKPTATFPYGKIARIRSFSATSSDRQTEPVLLILNSRPMIWAHRCIVFQPLAHFSGSPQSHRSSWRR